MRRLPDGVAVDVTIQRLAPKQEQLELALPAFPPPHTVVEAFGTVGLSTYRCSQNALFTR